MSRIPSGFAEATVLSCDVTASIAIVWRNGPCRENGRTTAKGTEKEQEVGRVREREGKRAKKENEAPFIRNEC